jgi:hypothetical protein
VNQSCVKGNCVCNSPLTDCGIENDIYYGCTDLADDTANCGKCGKTCPTNWCCVNGKCTNPVGNTDPQNCGSCGNICPSGICANGCCLSTAVNLNSAGGQGNYWISTGNCGNPVENLNVQLAMTQDFNSSNGFSFQLNAVPPPQSGAHPVTWMQFLITVTGNQVSGDVEIWNVLTANGGPNAGPWNNCILFSNQNVSGTCASSQSCSCSAWQNLGNWLTGGTCCSTQFASVPNSNYSLGISLATDSYSGNVTDVTFSLNNDSQLSVSIPPEYQAPIEAFQFVAVGPPGSTTAFTSGAANVTYSASSGLSLLGGNESCPGGSIYKGRTAETSNATYGEMSSCNGASFSQTINS